MKRLCFILAWLAFPAVCRSEDPKLQPILVLDAGGHTDSIPMVLFTPDGKQLISASKDKTIRVWSVSTGEMLRVLRPPIGSGRGGILYAAALSPDGRTLAVGGIGPAGKESPIYLLNFATGNMERVLKGHSARAIIDLAFSPDGKRLASCGEDRTVRIWDWEHGRSEQILQGHTREIYDIAFAPDGRRLASAAFDGTTRIWSVQTGETEAVLKDAYEGRTYWVWAVAWSPDGKTLATGSADQCIRLWQPDGTLRKRYGPFGDNIRSLAFTPDSRRLLFTRGYDRRTDCSLLDLSTGEEQVRFTRHTSGVWDGALSPDGTLAATAGFLGEELYLWKTANGRMVHRLGGRSRSTWSAAWSPDGKRVAWGNTGRRGYNNVFHPLERSFRLTELEFGEVPGDDFQRARTSRGQLSLQRVPRQDAVRVQEGERVVSTLRLSNNPPTCFTFLPKENQAAVGAFFGLYLFDARSGEQLRAFQGHTGDVWAVSPSSDGRYLVSAAADQTLRIWALDRDQPLLSLFFAGEEWVAWTPEGYYAASPGGEKLMGWQVNNGPDKMATFYPAEKFRKSLYRPDVIKRLLVAGSVEKALEQADQARGKTSKPIQVNEVLPPRVRITTPGKTGQNLDHSELRIEAIATSTGEHPVTALRLLLDGRPYAGQAGLKKITQPKLGEVKQSWSATLTPGRHRLAVQADSAVSQATSAEVEVIYRSAESEKDRPTVKLYVLAVGINDYPDKLRLRCAANDAKAVAEAFEEKSWLLFDKVQAKLLTDQKASRKGVLDGLSWLRKEMTQRDVAVVFFAGHGAKDNEGSLYLLPSDVDPDNLLATGIPGDQLKKALAALPGRVLFLLDACHAGAAGGDKRRAAEPLTDELVQDLATDDYGVVVMCAAMSREFSRESRRLGHGFFTQAVVEGLQGKGAKSSEGAVYLHHLDGYVTDRVKELTGGLQHPVTAKPTSIRSFPLSKP